MSDYATVAIFDGAAEIDRTTVNFFCSSSVEMHLRFGILGADEAPLRRLFSLSLGTAEPTTGRALWEHVTGSTEPQYSVQSVGQFQHTLIGPVKNHKNRTFS